VKRRPFLILLRRIHGTTLDEQFDNRRISILGQHRVHQGVRPL
jgi:hypothetical protein